MRKRWIPLAVLGACSTGDPGAQPLDPPNRCPPGGLTVSPVSLTLDTGDRARLAGQLDVCHVGADTSFARNDILWESSAPLVATVDSAGNVTAMRTGYATIRGRLRRDSRLSGASQVQVR